MYFCIDLDSKCPEVLEFPDSEIQLDLKFFNKNNALELSDPDRRIFKSEEEAESFLERYNEALRRLSREYRGNKSTAPCMLYKRRYLAQLLLGVKMHTERHYKRDWKAGDVFQFHDQVHFVPVTLTRITELKDAEGVYYRYDFKN